MDIINNILAGFVQGFKAKNPKIFGYIVTALVLAFVGIQVGISQGAFDETSMLLQVIQYIDVVMVALVGSKTAPFLSEYLNQSDVIEIQSASEDPFWAKLIDSFKVKSPVAYAILTVALLTSFAGITYSIQFGLIADTSVEMWLKIISYIELATLVLLGTRTGQYIITNPPSVPAGDTVGMATAVSIAEYYD